MDTLLIVDDEPGILEACAHALGPRASAASRTTSPRPQIGSTSESPYRLVLASSCERAAELFDEERRAGRQIVVGIFDLQMPGGEELLRRLREQDPELMCLVVTAAPDPPVDALASCFESKHDEWSCLAKPFHPSELRQAVRHLVTAWHRRRQRDCELEEANAAIESRTEALSSALQHARAATAAKSEFLAMMSHELRTPMNGIMGMTQALEHSALSASQRVDLQVIRDCSTAMALLLNDILDFSKIEAGRMEFAREPFVLRTEILQTAALFRGQCEAKGLEFRLRLDDELPELVIGDATRVRQVLGNALGNAVKFTQRGFVELRCRSRASAPPGNLRLEFEIEDTGIGIPAQRRQTLFKPFSQGDSSITRKYGGSGLGLVICSKLLAAMNGDMRLDSTEGVGTTCSFFLELPEGSPNVSPLLPPLVSDDLSTLRVLIAEDNPVNRLVADRLLQTCGIRAAQAEHGRQAVEAAVALPFDVVLMDMQMPEMDGLEATRQIRQRASSQPFIVALTANAFDGDRRACLAAGMDGFLSKPVQLEALRRVLASAKTRA
jgi:signal transduction histidine kinase